MERRIRIRLLRLILSLLAAAFLVSALLFLTTLQGVFSKQLSESNDHLAQQVRDSFEFAMRQIGNTVAKYAIRNNEILDALWQTNERRTASIQLYKTLDNIVLGNEYLHSVYLYAPQGDRIYSSERGASYAPAQFYDPEVLPALNTSVQRIVDSRLVTMTGGDRYLLSTIALPIASSMSQPHGVLLVNIDMTKLYNDIVRNASIDGNYEIYVYDRAGKLIVAPSAGALFQPVDGVREGHKLQGLSSWMAALTQHRAVLESDAASATLGWGFYLRTTVPIHIRFFENYALWLAGVALFVCASAIISYYMVRRSTQPLEGVMDTLNETILRDILTDAGADSRRALLQLRSIDHNFEYERFVVAMIEAPGWEDLRAAAQTACEACKPPRTKLMVRLVGLRGDCMVVVLNYSAFGSDTDAYLRQEQMREYLLRVHDQLQRLCENTVYLVAAPPRGSIAELSAACHACMDLMGRKLTLPAPVSIYEDLRPAELAYPEQLERQFVNNLVLGSEEGSAIYLERCLAYLLQPGMTDLQIRNCLYQLQNAVVKKLADMRLSAPLPEGAGIDALQTPEEIRAWFQHLMRGALHEVNDKRARDEQQLNRMVFAYIDEHFLDEDFNLNGLSYHFERNRNAIAKMIKEETGYSFSEYINRRKIQRARELLADGDLTVDAIAHRSGFAYTHYFIKVFKGIEGITPGRYREMLADAAGEGPTA